MTDFSDVGNFHQKFHLPRVCEHPDGEETCANEPAPRPLDDELMEFRVKFMHEELEEFEEGWHEGDHGKMFDALIDLVYVALGTAHLNGYPWSEGWALVQAANMAKVRAKADGSDSKRGSSFDVVKPPGWLPPDIDQLLDGYGWGGSTKDAPRCPGCKGVLDAKASCFTESSVADDHLPRRVWCRTEGRWVAI